MGSLKISNLNVTDGESEDELNLSWSNITGAVYYIIQQKYSPGDKYKQVENRKNIVRTNSTGKKNMDNWKVCDIINEPVYTLSGLKSGKKYSFRVAAVNAKKQGPWSRSIDKIIR